jgi:hypothetical protein
MSPRRRDDVDDDDDDFDDDYDDDGDDDGILVIRGPRADALFDRLLGRAIPDPPARSRRSAPPRRSGGNSRGSGSSGAAPRDRAPRGGRGGYFG